MCPPCRDKGSVCLVPLQIKPIIRKKCTKECNSSGYSVEIQAIVQSSFTLHPSYYFLRPTGWKCVSVSEGLQPQHTQAESHFSLRPFTCVTFVVFLLQVIENYAVIHLTWSQVTQGDPWRTQHHWRCKHGRESLEDDLLCWKVRHSHTHLHDPLTDRRITQQHAGTCRCPRQTPNERGVSCQGQRVKWQSDIFWGGFTEISPVVYNHRWDFHHFQPVTEEQ